MFTVHSNWASPICSACVAVSSTDCNSTNANGFRRWEDEQWRPNMHFALTWSQTSFRQGTCRCSDTEQSLQTWPFGRSAPEWTSSQSRYHLTVQAARCTPRMSLGKPGKSSEPLTVSSSVCVLQRARCCFRALQQFPQTLSLNVVERGSV